MKRKIATCSYFNGVNTFSKDFVKCEMYDESRHEAFTYDYDATLCDKKDYLDCFFRTHLHTKVGKGVAHEGEVNWELNREGTIELLKNLRIAVEMMDSRHGKNGW